MNSEVTDLTIYRSTRIRVPWGDDLGKALHDIDKTNRAAEECIALMSDRFLLRREQKWKAKMADFYKPLWPKEKA